MASGNMARIYFEGKHLHYANVLTIYIDDVEESSYEGGSSCSVEVTPGNHVITILVYNDASEEAYYLDPLSAHFEAGMEYDIVPGKSDDVKSRERRKESHNTYDPPKTAARATAAAAPATGGAAATRGKAASATGGAAAGTKNRRGWLVLIVIAAVLMAGIAAVSFSAVSFGDTNRTQTFGRKGFIFPDSDTKLIQQSEIEGLSDSDLNYAINEIYARHGYIFRDKDMYRYFKQFSWYKDEVPANEFSLYAFNQIEQQNWSLLVNERNSRKSSD